MTGNNDTLSLQVEAALNPKPSPGFVVFLPEPPSDNDTHMPVLRWRTPSKPYARMIRTPEYDAWRTLAGHQLNRQETCRIEGRVAISITLTDAGGGCDTMNVAKAALDLLVTHKLIEDDARRYVRSGHVDVWPQCDKVIPHGEMMIRVSALPDRRA